MLLTTTPSERIGRCTRMRRFLVRSNGPESFVHTRYSADFTIITSGFEFSVHTTKPNCSMLACSLRICEGGCLRVSWPSGFKDSTRTRFGLRLRDTAKPFPRSIGCRFIGYLLQEGQARITSGQISLRGTNAGNAPGIYHRTRPAEFTKLLSARAPTPRRRRVGPIGGYVSSHCRMDGLNPVGWRQHHDRGAHGGFDCLVSVNPSSARL